MHQCCVVFSKEFPTDNVLKKMLEPFDEADVFAQPEETRKYPAFTWDWYQIGGRYNGALKLSVTGNDDLYEWEYYAKEPRSGRLFRSLLLETMRKKHTYGFYDSEENYYASLGFRDGFLYVDGGKISDIINVDDLADCFCFVDVYGVGHARAYWDGNDYTRLSDEVFERLFKTAVEENGDGYICVVDLHD